MLIIYKLLQDNHGDGRDLGAVGEYHDDDSDDVLGVVVDDEYDRDDVLGDTNFLNILPQPMMIVMKAWWAATTMLSISIKSHIFRIWSFRAKCLWDLW